jgi:hypothetical protein
MGRIDTGDRRRVELRDAVASLTDTPRCSSISAITEQSRIRGTFVTTLRSAARIDAAISLSAEFLAPETWTVPSKRGPPVTRKRSIGRWYPAPGAEPLSRRA